jgi:hypothetical protein
VPGKAERVFVTPSELVDEGFEVIAINKVDVLNPERVAKLLGAIERHCLEVQIIEMASRPGKGMEAFFESLCGEFKPVNQVMEIAYARYGIGETLLGWVNVQAELEVGK